jgi:hypothetical protein
MNAEILRQIAYRTGGEYLPSRDAGNLREKLRTLGPLAAREEQKTEAIELHRWPYLLALVIALFSAEWVIRKRSGMI